MAAGSTVDVFEHEDFRSFLRSYYEHKKATRGLSYRALSKRIGLKSTSFYKHVAEGERNLTEEMALRFAEGLGLSEEGQSYFLDLVRFDQAKTLRSRNQILQRLRRYKRSCYALPLQKHHAEYHSKWYMPAIRELAARPDFRPDAEWIAARLRPRVSKREVEHALLVLERLGLLIWSDGRVSQSTPNVTTGAQATSLQIATYHETMLKMAAESMDRFPQSERDLSSITVCLDAAGVDEFKRRLQKFRAELLDYSNQVPGPRQVVQVNFQLFPLSDDAELSKDVP